MAESIKDRLRVANIPFLAGGDPKSQSAIAGFQLLSPHSPRLVVYPSTTEEVAFIVQESNRFKISLTVSSTGHGRQQSMEDGILISMSRMRSIRIETGSTLVHIAGGATWQDVVAATAPKGLAIPYGSSPGVGVVGYLLGGGFSIFGSTTGLAANRIKSLTCVTADGTVVQINRDEARERLGSSWIAAPKLGIVTGIELEGWDAGTLTGGGFTVFDDAVPWLMQAFQDWAPGLPHDITPSLRIMRIPSQSKFPALIRGRLAARVRLTALQNHDAAESELNALGAYFTVFDNDFRKISWSNAGAVYAEPSVPRAHLGNNLLSSSSPDLTTFLPSFASTNSSPLVLDVRHYGLPVTSANANRVTAPGDWITSVITPSPADVPHAQKELHKLLSRAVNHPLGSARNFRYGPWPQQTDGQKDPSTS